MSSKIDVDIQKAYELEHSMGKNGPSTNLLDTLQSEIEQADPTNPNAATDLKNDEAVFKAIRAAVQELPLVQAKKPDTDSSFFNFAAYSFIKV